VEENFVLVLRVVLGIVFWFRLSGLRARDNRPIPRHLRDSYVSHCDGDVEVESRNAEHICIVCNAVRVILSH